MASSTETAPAALIPEPVDLRRISARSLQPLLDEEIETWRDLLHWDFSRSAELVSRFVDMHALHGFALVERGRVTGYAYHVTEEHKALVGDIYVRRRHRGEGREERLLAATLAALRGQPWVKRIEAQLILLESLPELPDAAHARSFPRLFMSASLAGAPLAPARPPATIETWAERYQDAAALLIAAAYADHVDAQINDQYRTVAGARHFLYNIVQQPGCGSFCAPASCVALDRNRALCGVSLASRLAPHSGHIAQICVSSEVRGRGVGYALLRTSMAALREAGCTRVSLTVTAANRNAVALYRNVGFRTVREFPALVWEGF